MPDDGHWDIRVLRDPASWCNLGVHIDIESKHVMVFIANFAIVIGHSPPTWRQTWSLRERLTG